jgi:hypothetical protein
MSRLPYKTCPPGDIAIIALVILLGALSLHGMWRAGPAARLRIHRDNRLVASYPLPAHKNLTINGARGKMHVSIDGAHVAVTRSPCREQICVHRGRIRRPGDRIICVPNHIVISITGTRPHTDVDALAR